MTHGDSVPEAMLRYGAEGSSQPPPAPPASTTPARTAHRGRQILFGLVAFGFILLKIDALGGLVGLVRRLPAPLEIVVICLFVLLIARGGFGRLLRL